MVASTGRSVLSPETSPGSVTELLSWFAHRHIGAFQSVLQPSATQFPVRPSLRWTSSLATLRFVGCLHDIKVYKVILTNAHSNIERKEFRFCSIAMFAVCGRDRKEEVSSYSFRFLISFSGVALDSTFDFPCSDLSRVTDLQQVILGTFSSQSEEVRSAASYALGE